MKKAFIILSLLSLLSNTCIAAEYCGENIDGNLYSASAFSYSTGKYYDVNVEFSGMNITIYFDNGGSLEVSMNDEEIDDIHNISAFDYGHAVYWDINLSGY